MNIGINLQKYVIYRVAIPIWCSRQSFLHIKILNEVKIRVISHCWLIDVLCTRRIKVFPISYWERIYTCILRYISFYTESTEIQMYHEMLFYNFLMNYQSFTFMKFGSMLHCVTQFLHLMLIFQKTLLLNYDWKLSLHWL